MPKHLKDLKGGGVSNKSSNEEELIPNPPIL